MSTEFVIIQVHDQVLHPPSQQTRQLFSRLIDAGMYDSTYSEMDAGLLGLYSRLFDEDEMEAQAVWLAYRKEEPSKLIGVGLWMQGTRLQSPSPHRYVLPEYRYRGVGTALLSTLHAHLPPRRRPCPPGIASNLIHRPYGPFVRVSQVNS